MSNEALRLAEILDGGSHQFNDEAAALLRQQAERIAELEADLKVQARCMGAGAERELALMAERYQRRAEVERLRSAVQTFCDATSWSAQSWKDQPHIKPLFDHARTTRKDEG